MSEYASTTNPADVPVALVTLHPDGSVTIPEDMPFDEAARVFWDAIRVQASREGLVLRRANAVLEDAARAYVAARLANDNAEPRDWSARAAELERTWHDLVEASGLAMPEVSP